jgi:16S rRNA (guanine527-N7)-methyltransferase
VTTDRAPLPAGADALPPFPADATDVLARGLRELGLGDLDPASRTMLIDHLRLLLAWTTAINLTSVREPADAVRVHTLDALAGVPVLRASRVDAFVDLGSGGGLPGIPLAIALPAIRVLLVDSTRKKARFLTTAVEALGLAGRVDVAPLRAEALAADSGHRERWPAVTARAVASLAELVELAFPLLAPGGLLLAWKSGGMAGELASAVAAVRALGGGSIDLVDAGLAHAPDHVLAAIRKTGRTGSRWPRPPADRRRHPWRAGADRDAHNRPVRPEPLLR